jgi:hypothetical protein
MKRSAPLVVEFIDPSRARAGGGGGGGAGHKRPREDDGGARADRLERAALLVRRARVEQLSADWGLDVSLKWPGGNGSD